MNLQLQETVDQMYLDPQDFIEWSGSTYVNRELSWMSFNERVLEEARDKNNPLYERLNFLAITCSNLDEFFMIRVASLHDLVNADSKSRDPAGMLPQEQLQQLMARCRAFYKTQYSTFNRSILPALAAEEIHLISFAEAEDDEREFLERYFRETVYPVLTPLAVDSGRPFPLIVNQTLNLFVTFSEQREHQADPDYIPFAIVQVPSVLPRIVPLPGTRNRFVLLEDIVKSCAASLFYSQMLESVSCFRIMRNADFEIDEDDISDLMLEIEDKLRLRERGEVIRLEIEKSAGKEIVSILQNLLEVEDQAVFRIRGPIDLKFLNKVPSFFRRPDLRYDVFRGQVSPLFAGAEDGDYLAVIRQQDVLLHHPYESFDPTIRIIQQASADPDVLAIKQTLYRVSGQSPIVAALAEAAESGKQVTVLVELKARFDEENNILWARRLEKAGCHVIYGLKGLKTHSKITLIVRREAEGIRRYVHLGTGNYNDQTAKIYTDCGLWTCADPYGRDATDFFNMITGYSIPLGWNKLVPAPRWLRGETIARIEQEISHAQAGKRAVIVAKINSLVDQEIIEALYRASQAGVKIRLIVRGICCLRPGIIGLSENIEVRSLVGRFLEHSRIFYYYNDGREDLFLSSADWMPRNLDRRIELLFPVEDTLCRQRLFEILLLELQDTLRARIMKGDGSYERIDRRGREALDSQIALCRAAAAAAEELGRSTADSDRYLPQTAQDMVGQ